MDCSTPGFPVLHQLLKLAQTHIHRVSDAIHLILCRPLLLLPSIFPSIRVFSNESVLRIRWPKNCSFSFSISSSAFSQLSHPFMTTEKNVAWTIQTFVSKMMSLLFNMLSRYVIALSSKEFSSVTQSCPSLCDPMNRSMPGFPVHHQLLESTQTHVH